MALRNIREMGDDILTKECRVVKDIVETTVTLSVTFHDEWTKSNDPELLGKMPGSIDLH